MSRHKKVPVSSSNRALALGKNTKVRIFLDARAAFAIEPPTASRFVHAGVVKLVDTLVLGTSGASRGGSSPSARTNNAINVCLPNREGRLLFAVV